MTENTNDFPAVLLLARIDRERQRVVAFADNRVLRDEEELEARAGLFLALEANGGIGYRLMAAPAADADEALADFRADLAAEAGWNDEAGSTAVPPAPESRRNETKTDPPDPTTDRAACQAVAVMIVEYDGIPPWPCTTAVTGQLLGLDGDGLKPAHSVAETRLLLAESGYRPEYARWRVLDRGGENVRRAEVYVKVAEAEAPASGGPGFGIAIHRPLTPQEREALMAKARVARGEDWAGWDPVQPDPWYRENAHGLNAYGPTAVRY